MLAKKHQMLNSGGVLTQKTKVSMVFDNLLSDNLLLYYHGVSGAMAHPYIMQHQSHMRQGAFL